MNDPDPSDPLRGTRLLALVGPTAVGKSALALALCERMGAEIVSLDSMQVYRGLDIGTAKPSAEERARVPHHMLDLALPSERFDVQRYVRELAPVLDDLAARGKQALFVGGTGFYLKVLTSGLFEGPDVDVELRARLMRRAASEGDQALHAELGRVDPVSAARIHPHDTKRVVRGLEVYLQTGKALSSLHTQWAGLGSLRPRRIVGLRAATPELDRRIRERTRGMFEAGWPAEAARVRASGGFGVTAVQALGYAEALRVHDGELGLDEAVLRIALATRQFARRQRTWYRKFPDITWLELETHAERGDLVAAALRALEFDSRP